MARRGWQRERKKKSRKNSKERRTKKKGQERIEEERKNSEEKKTQVNFSLTSMDEERCRWDRPTAQRRDNKKQDRKRKRTKETQR